MTGASGVHSPGTTFQLFAKVIPTGKAVPIDDLDLRFDELVPIRKPHVTRTSKHMPGKWFSSISGKHVQYDSLLEKCCLLQLDFEGQFVDIVEQPFRIKVTIGDRPQSHVPDFLLRTREGAMTLVDVKPARRLDDPRVAEQFAYTQAFCTQAGITYRVMSEPDPQLLANLKWLRGYRDLELNRSLEFSRMWSALGEGPLSLEALLLGAEEQCLARPVLFASIWRGLFTTDLLLPLTSETEIRRGDDP